LEAILIDKASPMEPFKKWIDGGFVKIGIRRKGPTIEEEETVDIIYSITVKPRLNLWFGFINLNTNEKREYTTPNSTTLNINEQRWLLITGHGRVTIITDSETLRISDKRKHFFYIDNTGVREIDYAEFKELNGGRGW